MRRRLVVFIGVFFWLYAGWMLLVGANAAPEWIAGVAAAAVAAYAADAVRRSQPYGFTPRLRWLARTRHLPVAVVADLGLLAGDLRRRLRGEKPTGAFRAVPFTAGGEDAFSSARRALATLAVSLTPNTYVIGIDWDKNEMLVHELVPGERRTAPGRILGRLR